jgi:ParB family transcriptional regulator, chromosome partitioning protein
MSRLTDKARSINFDADEQPDASGVGASAPPAGDKPRTAIGRLSASFAVEAENRQLKERLAEFEDAKVIEFLDPKRIRPSRYANRHELSFAGAEFRRLRDEVASAGRNVQPIKVRRLKAGEGGAEFEIVFGHRRHRACLELGLAVAAVVEDMSDAELFAEMDRENRQREDLSPWEQGVMYKRALDDKLFPSVRKLADQVGASHGAVGMAVQMASLPIEVIQAFSSPLEVQFRWVAPLAHAVERNAGHVAQVARQIAAEEPRPGAREVFARLTSEPGALATGMPQPLEFLREGRRAGYLARDERGNVTIKIKAGALTEAQQRRLTEFVSKLFQ